MLMIHSTSIGGQDSAKGICDSLLATATTRSAVIEPRALKETYMRLAITVATGTSRAFIFYFFYSFSKTESQRLTYSMQCAQSSCLDQQE